MNTTPATAQMLISQGPQPQPVVILGQQGQTPMGRHRFVGPFELEGQHCLVSWALPCGLKGLWLLTPFISASRAAYKVFTLIPISVLGH